MAEDSVQKAGSVKITELKLISNNNTVWDLTEFLVELNIYEDMFSNYLHGNMVLSDSRNLIENVPIIGEEYLIVKVQTPTFDSRISKTFRVYKLSDRNVVRDNNTQLFTLHFASIELFYDILLPLFVPFEGNITDVAGEIFSNYIAASREYQVSEASDEIKELETETPLVVLNDSANKVKFISPGWTPFKCLNWLATKAIPKDGKAKNFLFFETNKAFYFGAIEHVFKESVQNELSIGKYSISASNIRDGDAVPDINREYFIAKDVEMVETTDHIKNYTNGYLANRLITLDIYNKDYKVTDYDYVNEYKNQFHTSGSGPTSVPVFTAESLRNFATSISFYPINPRLFQETEENYFKENVNEKMPEIYGNRKSSLLDLTNIKMHLTVPGRTDIEVGRILYFSYPALGAKDDKNEEGKEDKSYSGYYLITAIHHKINKIDHSMRMEIVKDSLYVEKGVQ